MYSLNKQAISSRQQCDILWVRLYFEKETFTDPCWQDRETSRTRPSCRKDENVSCQSCQLDTRETLLRFPRMFQTHPVHGDDWVMYSDSVGTIVFAESFASFYYWRRYSDPDLSSSGAAAVRCARKQTRVEWKFDNNYCSRYQWDCHSLPLPLPFSQTVESRRREGRACGIHKFRYTALCRSQIG